MFSWVFYCVTYSVPCLEFTHKQWQNLSRRGQLLKKWEAEPCPAPLPKKTFKPSHVNLPTLDKYSSVLPADYWSRWIKKTYDEVKAAASWVNPDQVRRVAISLGYTGREHHLLRNIDRLTNGACIGCKGDGRLPTSYPNSPSAMEFGVRVADSLQDWIVGSLSYGPLDYEEIPFKEFTVNPISVKIKPNGKARVCINMSAPYKNGKEVEGTPMSVNDGIDKHEFPTEMSTTKDFCTSLMKAGCPAEMCKLDWNSAYKHIAVRKEDHPLQIFEFGGKFFGEVMLTFGCSSSAGIYDDLAKLVKDFAIRASRVDRAMINQILDDVVGCGSQGDGTVGAFYDAYRRIATEVGVSLADETDVDKAFRVSHIGKVFGISYDLQRWTWYLADDKLIPLLISLKEVSEADVVDNGQLLSLTGKLNHFMWLVPGGPWQRGFLLKIQHSEKPSGYKVKMTPLAKAQAAWWFVHLRAAREESPIMDPRPMEDMKPINIFSDAAGGDASKLKNGAGGFIPPSDWFYMPWSKLIREDRLNSEGVPFAHKLCTLEGLAALIGLTTIPDRARNRQVVIHCDNMGFVQVFKKGHSSCPYAYTVAKALFDVAQGLAARVRVVKTKRCSGMGEIAADALSKGDWEEAWLNMPLKKTDPGRVPRAILQWAENPTTDIDLGEKILADMRKFTDVLLLKTE